MCSLTTSERHVIAARERNLTRKNASHDVRAYQARFVATTVVPPTPYRPIRGKDGTTSARYSIQGSRVKFSPLRAATQTPPISNRDQPRGRRFVSRLTTCNASN